MYSGRHRPHALPLRAPFPNINQKITIELILGRRKVGADRVVDQVELEAGLAVVEGKPLVNSVTGEEERLESVLPLVKKHGAAVIAISNDEIGISEDPDVRFAVAKKIVERPVDRHRPHLPRPAGKLRGEGREPLGRRGPAGRGGQCAHGVGISAEKPATGTSHHTEPMRPSPTDQPLPRPTSQPSSTSVTGTPNCSSRT